MRYKRLSKVKTPESFVILDVQLEWSENPVLYGHSTVLTLYPTVPSTTIQVTLEFDETLLDMTTLSTTQYKFTPKQNQDAIVDIHITVKDIVYKQIKNLTTQLVIQEYTPGTPNNYTVYDGE